MKMDAQSIQQANETAAYMDGYAAWQDGATLTSNPNSGQSGAWIAWREGWADAEKDGSKIWNQALGQGA